MLTSGPVYVTVSRPVKVDVGPVNVALRVLVPVSVPVTPSDMNIRSLSEVRDVIEWKDVLPLDPPPAEKNASSLPELSRMRERHSAQFHLRKKKKKQTF
jgi:hypothetical protein